MSLGHSIASGPLASQWHFCRGCRRLGTCLDSFLYFAFHQQETGQHEYTHMLCISWPRLGDVKLKHKIHERTLVSWDCFLVLMVHGVLAHFFALARFWMGMLLCRLSLGELQRLLIFNSLLDLYLVPFMASGVRCALDTGMLSRRMIRWPVRSIVGRCRPHRPRHKNSTRPSEAHRHALKTHLIYD